MRGEYNLSLWSFKETINTKQCEQHRTISLMSHAAKVLLKFLKQRLYIKLDSHIEEEDRNATGLLKVFGKKYVGKDKKRACGVCEFGKN